MSFKRHRFSIVAFAVALAIYLAAYFHYQRYDWGPLEFPIHKLGENNSGKFLAQLDSEHNVLIEFDQTIDSTYWNCVYGAEIFTESCPNVTSAAEVYWSIMESKMVVSSGFASGPDRWAGSGNGFTQSKITSIDAGRNLDYTISVTLLGPENILEETNPRVVVELPPSLHKDAFVAASLISMLGHVFFISAVVALSIELYFKSHSNKALQ